MSTHRVDIVRLGPIEKHPNADTLGVTKILGYTVVVKLGEWVEGELGVYIEPDYVVPDRPEYAFLWAGKEPTEQRRRIRVKRLRGIMSHGLLLKLGQELAGVAEGEDVRERLWIERYVPPEPMTTEGEDEKGPAGWFPVYDLESWRRYRHVFRLGEQVSVTEKLHGCSGRYVWADNRLYAGSRTRWKKPPEPGRSITPWWRAVERCPWIPEWCQAHPAWVLYGECFGQVQDLKYGAGKNDVFFRAFDVLTDDGQWIDTGQFRELLPAEHRVPELFVGPYDPESLEALAAGKSRLADHVREGAVIKPIAERTDPEIGRVAFKLVNDEYLERA